MDVKLRKLSDKDYNGMLEWMHDDTINCYFQYDFKSMKKDDVKKFIADSQSDECNCHRAVVLEDNEYLGTISLKNIDAINETAEYAISMRKCVQGTGVAAEATRKILKYAFENLNLHRVFLNVMEDNRRARKFYEKIGFRKEGESQEAIKKDGKYVTLYWYAMLKNDYKSN